MVYTIMSIQYQYQGSTGTYNIISASGTFSDIVIPLSHNDGTNGDKPVTGINDFAFQNVTVTGTLTLNNITTIGQNAFINLSGLVNSLNLINVTYIGPGAFQGCSGLTGPLDLSSAITIGANAFRACSNLTGPLDLSSAITIGSSAFYECRGLTGSLDLSSVITIGNFAFYNCVGLTGSLVLSSAITIGSSAFYECRGLTGSLDLSSVITIGNFAFYNCVGLTGSLVLSSVVTIENSAFQDCRGFNNELLILPASLTTIDNQAFNTCSIPSYDFRGCGNITIDRSIFIQQYLRDVYVYITPTQTVTGTPYPYVNFFFYTTTITFTGAPNNVGIGQPVDITSYLGSNRPTDPYVYAFDPALARVDSPNIITLLTNTATTINISQAANDNYGPSNVIPYLLNPNLIVESIDDVHKLACVTGVYGTVQDLVIPSKATIDGIEYTVVAIADDVFVDKLSGTITFPSTLTSIGASAFRGCALTGMLILPPNLTVLNDYVFAECDFTSMAPPTQLTHIGARAFYNLPLFVYDFTQCESLSYIDPSAFDEYNQSFLDINVYVSRFTYERIRNFPFPPYVKLHTGVPVSNICFVAGTLVKIDQGIFPIESLTRKHTLRGQPITLTKTKHDDPYLVKIQAYAFDQFPTHDTYMSMNHRVYFNDRVKARDLVNGVTVTLVDYHGEPLYNVLVKAHTSMLVHGMLVETLDPTSPIALLYTSKLSPNQKNQLIEKLNRQTEYEDIVIHLKRNQ